MTIASLEEALGALGLPCTVEVRDRLAIVIPRGDVTVIEEAHRRREALRLAREHGFTHIALELTPSPESPAHVGDGGASTVRRATVHRD